MNSRYAMPLFLCLVLFCGAGGTAVAQPTCSSVCNPLMDCMMPCWNGHNMTCLEYGICNEDPDGDGVLWENDNCPRNYNPNQADCDGDQTGNVCDSLNGIFVPSGNKIACASDKKEYPFYSRYKVTYQQVYVDTTACQSASRWNHSTVTQDCYGFCDELDDNACGGACWNKTGYQCDFGLVCGSNLGSWHCNPDTIP